MKKVQTLPGKVRIIGGQWRGRQLKITANPHLRPTPDRVRETLFNWLASHIVATRCLDLFAGTGVLGFEALSRGAQEVIFVDNHPLSVKSLMASAQTLQAQSQCQVIQMDALAYLQQNKQGSAFDIIFLDPPFHSVLLAQSLQQLMISSLVKAETLIYIEAPSDQPLPVLSATWQVLKHKTAGQVNYYLVQVGES